MINSAIYNGQVIHKRFKPKVHYFKYKVFSLLIDLSELETLDKKVNFFSFHFPKDGKTINFSLFTSQKTGIHLDFLFSLPINRDNCVLSLLTSQKTGNNFFFLFTLPAERENISLFHFPRSDCD